MNVKSPYRVHLVVDPEFGERLSTLPADEPVWVVASPLNESAARQLWQQRPTKSHLDGVSVFDSYDGDREEAVLGTLDTIDLHHGEHSATPPYSLLEVIGCPASESIRAALAELGFSVVAATTEGFSAQRSIPVA